MAHAISLYTRTVVSPIVLIEKTKGKREVWYHKAHTIQEEISHADGWESDKEDDETTERTFWGYIVELKDVVVKPLVKSDDNSN